MCAHADEAAITNTEPDHGHGCIRTQGPYSDPITLETQIDGPRAESLQTTDTLKATEDMGALRNKA